MKKTICPKCNTKFKVLGKRNTNLEKYKPLRKNKKGKVTQWKKTTKGVFVHIALFCGCSTKEGKIILNSMGKSNADALRKIYAYGKKKTITSC